MPMTVMAGLPGSDARARLDDVLSEAVAGQKSAMLVLPSAAHATRARAELASFAPVGLRAVGIARLVEVEWSLQGDGRHIVEPLHRNVLLSRALAFAGVVEDPGPGATALLGTLAARACGQGSVRTERVRSGLPERLARSLDAYLESLGEEGLVEAAEATRLLAECSPPADLVVFDTLTAYSSEQLAMLRGWSRAGCEVIVRLPWRAGCAATQPLDALVAELEAGGATIVGSADHELPLPPELARVVSGLFSGGIPASAEGRVVLGVAQGDEAEARLIAGRVSELLAAGTSADRIAVAFADPARHTGWLARAFDDAGVDAVWDVRTPVPETPLGRAMLRLWSLASGPMRREDYSALLRSPFSGVAAARADHADMRWRAHRTEGRALFGLVGTIDRVVSESADLAAVHITADAAKKWKELADRLMAHAYGSDAPTPGMDGALDAAVHRAFCQALSAACAMGEARVSAREMWAAFAASTVSPASASAGGGVLVTSTRALAMGEFDDVIVGGLTASETPRRGSDDRLEGEAVRQVMRVFGLSHDPEEQVRAERLAFYLALSSARSSLTLVRRDSDDEGRALRASVFWDEFLDLYRVPGSELDACAGLPETIIRPADRAQAPGGGRCAARGLLEDEESLALLSGIDAVGPGEVERYAACPYRWFVERRLRPKTPDATVDVLTAGSVAHEALAEFYRRWPDVSGSRRVGPADADRATTLMRSVASEALDRAPSPTTLEEEWLLASVEPSVTALVARDAHFLPGYEPIALEWSFGLGEGDAPIDIGGVKIKGRADRVDLGPDGLVVIDYKRSHASSLSQIRDGGLVQLQLYALAASLRLGHPVAGGLYRSLARADDRGFVATGVPGAFKAADVVGASEIADLLEAAAQTAREAFAGIRAGHIEPSPARERCGYCVALPFCPQGVR